MSDILYRPQLGYEKKYDTTGTFPQDGDNDTSGPAASVKDPLQDLKDDINKIDIVLGSVPDSLAGPVRSVLSGIKHVVNEIDPQSFDNSPTPGIKVVVKPGSPIKTTIDPISDPSQGTLQDPAGIIMPDDIFSDSIPNIDVTVVTTEMADIIPLEYDKTIIAIASDYTSNLKKSLTTYLSNVAIIATQAGMKDMSFLKNEYTAKSTDLKNKDLQHLSDVVIRSQIVRDQKSRMMKKLHSPKETITQIRACKVAKQLRERYYSEAFVENKEYLDVGRNELLSTSRMVYDAKYKENLFNLYKYLNSSVILISECLGMMIQESQAKAVLYKEEGMK